MTDLPQNVNGVISGPQVMRRLETAIRVSVASIANPATELALLGTVAGQLRYCYQAAVGNDDWTLYVLDATTAATNSPYTVASLTAGLKWVAVAGRYVAGAMSIAGGVTIGSTLSVIDGNFSIIGSSDATKALKFEVDAQTTGKTLTVAVGAQTLDRTLSVPVLTGNDTLMTLATVQSIGGAKDFTAGLTVSSTNLTLNDVNVVLGTVIGTQWGTDPAQLQAFWGATPVIRPSGNVITALSDLGLISSPTIDAGNLTGTVPVANGGTNITSYAVGDILYASGATTLSKLADVATGNALISGGVTTAPSWGKIGLTTHISGILASANGGTGVSNAGTLTNASNTTITGGGTLALGGFTLTTPATGTAALLATANRFTTKQQIVTSGTYASPAVTSSSLEIEGNGTTTNPAIVCYDNVNLVEMAFGSFAGSTIFGTITSHALNLRTANSDRLTISSAGVANVTNTTSASSATTGALTIGNGTTATNVAIGGGIAIAGTGFGVGAVPDSTTAFDFTSSADAVRRYRVTNASAGTAAQSLFVAGNGTSVVQYGVTGTGFTAYGALAANMGQMYSNAASGIVVMADNATGPVVFASGGNAARARVSTSGNLLVGTTADTGITGAGGLRVANTTSASSSTVGAAIIGDLTAATTVAIGGGNINAGGNLTTAGTANRITIGSVAAVGTALAISKTQTATTGQDLGISVTLTLANLSSKASQNTGIAGNITIDPTASSTTGACVGLLGSVDVNSTTNTHAQPTGVQCAVRKGGANAITTAVCLDTSFSTSAAGTVGSVRGLYQSLSNSGGATVTTAYGIYLEAITLATTNYAFFSAGGGLVSIGDTTDSTSPTTGGLTTASGIGFGVTKSIFGGGFKSTSATLGMGYATGAGGTVTQASSRTTGVTLDKICGSITLVSAAGSIAWQSFTVTNSTVAATDTIRVCQKSGTDLNLIHVTAVAAGSFQITFATTAGVTVEQPVFNFTVIKSVAA